MGELTYPGNGIPDAFRSVLDELPGGVLVYRGTREKEILYASKGVIQMLECKDAHEFINYTFGSFRHFVYSDDVGRVEREIDEQMRSTWIPEIRNESFDRVSPIIYFQEQPTAV